MQEFLAACVQRPSGLRRNVAATALGLLTLLGAAAPAAAALGGHVSSVEADRAHFGARAASLAHADYTVHELTLANGAVIREFANASDTVFAVTWRGPSRPDLRQILGPHFDALQEDNAAPVRRARTPLRVERSDLRVSTGGHPGAFWGRALLPSATPADFTAADLQ